MFTAVSMTAHMYFSRRMGMLFGHRRRQSYSCPFTSLGSLTLANNHTLFLCFM